MTYRRRTTTALALLTTAALSGCGLVGTADDAAAPPRVEDPKQTLLKSTDALDKGNYTFAVSGDVDSQRGTVHLPESALIRIDSPDDEPSRMDMLVVGPDRYLKMKADLGADVPSAAELNAMLKQGGQVGRAAKQLKELKTMFDGKHWLHVDPAKIDDPAVFAEVDNPDASGAGFLVSRAATAVRAGDTITGTLDLSAEKPDQLPLDEDRAKALGAKLKSLPYKATLDAQGRLAKLAVDLPAAGKHKASTLVAEISGYGAAKAESKPSGDQAIEMSAEMYKAFNEK